MEMLVSTEWLAAELTAPGKSPEETVIQIEAVEAILETLRNSDDKNRRIALGLFLGFTHEQIAAGLGISRVAVTNRIKSMRGALALEGVTC